MFDLMEATVKMAEITEIAKSGWGTMSRHTASQAFLYFKMITVEVVLGFWTCLSVD